MAFKEIKVQEEISPNLIPMIDIMFLLLLFFMLNADMSQRELEELTPPLATHSSKDDPKLTPGRITVNIHHDLAVDCPLYKNQDVCRNEAHWRISVAGRRYTLDKDGMARLGATLFELGKSKNPNPSDPQSISEQTLIIRADRTAPYGHVQKVMEQTGAARIYRVEVGAGLPKEAANKQ
jgi:biopolymer transport protein ExbD